MLLCIFLILFLVKHSIIVSAGAKYGLMLWYQNVIPLLLPFMIISNLCLLQTRKKEIRNSFTPIIYTILLGTLCGYPLGAKCTADFKSNQLINNKTANLLLPLCNNASPMFLGGYIGYHVLKNKLPLPTILLLIYTPYILFFICSYIFLQLLEKHSKNTNKCASKSETSFTYSVTDSENLFLNSIQQITYVGIFIMLCSIFINLIYEKTNLNENIKAFLAAFTEITQGSIYLDTTFKNPRIKIALILGLTSFGGMSSILQTYQVIKQSGLSITYYTVAKIICGITTGVLYYLLVI